MTTPAGLALLWALAFPAVSMAEDSPLICFGVEPSWGVDLTQAGSAQFTAPGAEPVSYSGAATRNELLKELVWRGVPEAGGDLVVFLREAACSDGMSDTLHPVIARVSTADGRFLAGCCRIPATVESVSDTPLEGTSWRLGSLGGESLSALAASPRPVIARFEAGRLSGFSGCNNFMGSYSVDGDSLAIGPLAGSMMACDEDVMAIENALHAALSAVNRFSISADQLTLLTGSGTALAFTAEPPPRLGGVTWEVTGYNNNRQAVVGLLGDSRVTLSFEEGTVSGHASCNSFRATYSTDGSRIEIGPPATTRMACPEPLMEEERAFLAALQSAVTWSLDGNILDMHRADGERAIMAIIKR
ncbi:MAG: META domain-containing protein [Halieaceae bacterium]|nr:META domain-containing protein [Halieaceae bacterium]